MKDSLRVRRKIVCQESKRAKQEGQFTSFRERGETVGEKRKGQKNLRKGKRQIVLEK